VKSRAPVALSDMGRESIHHNGAAAPIGGGADSPEQARIARALCEDAAAQPSALLLEQWASMLLGAFWSSRRLATRDRAILIASGGPVIQSIARVGRADAKLALLAMGRLDRGALGARARELADGLSGPLPPWVNEVGAASLTRAFLACSPPDGEVVLFRCEGVGLPAHMLAVYIDARHRWIAKHVALLHDLDPLRPDSTVEDECLELRFRAADVEAMRRKVARAIRRTDVMANPPVDDGFTNYRALALARLSPLAS
jgi:hypothetical protein